MQDSFRKKITSLAQQGLAIDDVRNKLDRVIGYTERIPQIESSTGATQREVHEIREQLLEVHDVLDNLHARARRVDDQLLKLLETVERLHLRMLDGRPEIPEIRGDFAAQRSGDRFVHTEPEFYLASFLYNFLPNRVLLDVGANEGEYTQVAADAGYRVFSFEPFPEAYRKLEARFAGRENVTTFNFALGATEGMLPFYLATESGQEQRGDASLYNTFRPHFIRENITFEKQLEVPVRTLHSLILSGEVPAAIDLLKIDTEGYDLEVISGLGPIRPAIVQSEFWGKGFIFVRQEPQQESLANSGVVIETMRKFGYHWNLGIFRIEGESRVRFATNLAEAPHQAWGNLLFFREHAIFFEAFRWCQTSLPQFKVSL
jgi:FkbM family methyltransferase